MKDFNGFIQHCNRYDVMSDAAFLAFLDGLHEGQENEFDARYTMLEGTAIRLTGTTADEFAAWFDTCVDRWKTDPDSFKPVHEPAFVSKSINALMGQDLPPVRFIVEGLLPQGLALLVSPPKYGKSWMCLDLCIAVASGGEFLERKANKSRCLYLALEDSEHRLQARIRQFVKGESVPDGFDYAINAANLDDGLIDQMQNYVDHNKDTGLIIVDTLQKIRGCAQGREGAYSADYREMGMLKTFADRNNVCVLLIHHLRKANDDADPFNRISGTNGIMGAADTIMVLTKDRRNESDTLLSITGRDVDQSETVIHFDKEECRWKVLGEADALRAKRARDEYEADPVVITIKTLLMQGTGRWEGTIKDLMQAGELICDEELAPTPEKLAAQLKALYPLLLDYDGIKHSRSSNGTGGGKHCFDYGRPLPESDQTEIATNGCNGSTVENI